MRMFGNVRATSFLSRSLISVMTGPASRTWSEVVDRIFQKARKKTGEVHETL
jgi:hypothetical protein